MAKKIDLEAGEEIVVQTKSDTKWKSKSMKNEQQYTGHLTVTNKKVIFRQTALVSGLDLYFNLDEIDNVSVVSGGLFSKAVSISLKTDKYGTGNKQIFKVPKAEEITAAIQQQMK